MDAEAKDAGGYLMERLPGARLGEIEPLWRELNALHAERSRDFRNNHEKLTFAARTAAFAGLGEDGLLLLVVRREGRPAGYVLATARDGHGELESLYLEPGSRHGGLGSELVRRAVTWMRERGCSIITLSVAAGNEGVLPFYEALGFRLRRLQLELVRP